MNKRAPVSAAELLDKEFLEPSGLMPEQLAAEVDMPVSRIKAILASGATIDTDIDQRLCRYFGLSEGYWLRADS